MTPLKISMMRAATLIAYACLANGPLRAATECPVPAFAAKPGDQITDWHEKYILPAMIVAGLPGVKSASKEQAEALVDKLQAFHQASFGDPLFFEPLAQKISIHYGKVGDFKGLNTSTAEKINKAGAGTSVDFSALCIDTRRIRFPDDTFAITMFGVNNDNCRHASLRGIVFTSILINGATNGECRPDHAYTKRFIFPVSAGTNNITFLCEKDANGCTRR